jgi:hypothetical protein
MMRVLFLTVALTLQISAVALAQDGPPGIEDRPPYTVHAEPETPPQVPDEPGATFRDPVFGTRIMRITSGGGTHAYSYWPTFNLDSTWLYVFRAEDGQPYAYRFDPDTFTLRDREPMFVGGRCLAEDAIWSGTSRNVMHCHDGDGNIKAYNVVTRKWRTIASLRDAVGDPDMHTWQMSRSIGNRRFAFTWKNADYQNVGWIVYNRRTDAVKRYATPAVDEVQVDKSGRYLIHKTGDQGAGRVEVIVNDLRTGRRTELVDDLDFAPGHSDVGRGTVYGAENWEDRLLGRDLGTPKDYRPLLKWPVSFDGDSHTSALADSEDEILVSRYGSRMRDTPLANELFLLASDGSGRVRRLAHTYMAGTEYYHLARATLSRDGRWVTFASNYGGATGDVYVLEARRAPATGTTRNRRSGRRRGSG